jgi:phosphate transport system permease protein
MTIEATPTSPAAGLRRRGRVRPGDAILYVLTLLAALVGVVLLILIGRNLVQEAWDAITTFGVDFFTDTTWDPTTDRYGAASFIFGTAVSSLGALLLATPISLAIALFLTELAPGLLRGPVATLVELLAAVPSVVLGLWGILVMGPWIVSTLGPFLNSILGWTPFFDGDPTTGSSMLAAILILTIMIVPIVTSICTELFRQVPRDLKEGALALGATRWEMVRGVVFPYARAGIAAALILGLGRAIGEAIAVTQVIGNQTNISLNLFEPGDTLASRIASQYVGAVTQLQISSLVYLALILLVFSLVTNLVALGISRRVARRQLGRT